MTKCYDRVWEIRTIACVLRCCNMHEIMFVRVTTSIEYTLISPNRSDKLCFNYKRFLHVYAVHWTTKYTSAFTIKSFENVLGLGCNNMYVNEGIDAEKKCLSSASSLSWSSTNNFFLIFLLELLLFVLGEETISAVQLIIINRRSIRHMNLYLSINFSSYKQNISANKLTLIKQNRYPGFVRLYYSMLNYVCSRYRETYHHVRRIFPY